MPGVADDARERRQSRAFVVALVAAVLLLAACVVCLTLLLDRDQPGASHWPTTTAP